MQFNQILSAMPIFSTTKHKTDTALESYTNNTSDNGNISSSMNTSDNEIQNETTAFTKVNKTNTKKSHNHNADFKKRFKEIKKIKISNNLQSLLNNEIKKENHNKDLNVSISIIKGPLNGYIKLKYPNPINLKMIRNTRNSRIGKRIASINECRCGDKVAIINNVNRHYKQLKEVQTGIFQVYGVITKISYEYMTVMIPTNHDHENKEFIQRNIYRSDIRNSKYGAVFLIPK